MEQENVNAIKIIELEKRVETLEKHREKDKEQVHDLDKSLGTFIVEMKNISNELKTIVNNFKEAIMRSTDAQHKEVVALKEKVIENDKKIEKLSAKLDKETTGADAEKWKKYSSYVLTAIIGAIISFVLMQIGIK